MKRQINSELTAIFPGLATDYTVIKILLNYSAVHKVKLYFYVLLKILIN